MKPDSSADVTTETQNTEAPAVSTQVAPKDVPTLYRKDFLKQALGHIQLAEKKMNHAFKCSETSVAVSKEMASRISENFDKADIYVTQLIGNPGKSSPSEPFNGNVFFESTPAKIREMRSQLSRLSSNLSDGSLAENGADFQKSMEEPRERLSVIIKEISRLSGKSAQIS